MTTQHKLWIAAAVLLGMLALVFGRAWVIEHEQAVVVAAQQQGDKETIVALQKQEAVNQAQLSDVLKSLVQMKQTVQTPAQVAQALPQIIELPQRATVVTDAQAKQIAAALPNAPAPVHEGDLVIPKESVKAFYDAQVDCKANDVKLQSCGETVQHDQQIDEVKDKQIKQLNTALKGGTKWQRTKSALKYIGIGAAIGAGAIAYSHH